MLVKNESILDKPQDTLDSTVWSIDAENGETKLTEEAETKIQAVVDYV